MAALEVLRHQSEPDDAFMLVLPADHVIRDLVAFEASIKQAVELAKQDALVTFGVQLTRPETGYGYFRSGENFSVVEFVEKPPIEMAQAYLDSGEYLWNSGLFLFRAKVFLDELAVHRDFFKRQAKPISSVQKIWILCVLMLSCFHNVLKGRLILL